MRLILLTLFVFLASTFALGSSLRDGLYAEFPSQSAKDCLLDVEQNKSEGLIVLTLVSNPDTRFYCNSEGTSTTYQCFTDDPFHCLGPIENFSSLAIKHILNVLDDGNLAHVYQTCNLAADQQTPMNCSNTSTTKYNFLKPFVNVPAKYFQSGIVSYDQTLSLADNCAQARAQALNEAMTDCKKYSRVKYNSCGIIKEDRQAPSSDIYGNFQEYACTVTVTVEGK